MTMMFRLPFVAIVDFVAADVDHLDPVQLGQCPFDRNILYLLLLLHICLLLE